MVKIWYLLIFAYYTRSYLALHGLTLIFCVLTFIVFDELNHWSRPFCVFMSDLRDFLGQDWFQVMPNLLSSEGWGMALARPKASLSHCDWVWNQETNGIKGEGWENGRVFLSKSMSHGSWRCSGNWRMEIWVLFGARIKVSKIESYGSSQRHLCFCPESAALTIRIKNVQTIVWISGIWPCLMKRREFEALSGFEF